MKILGRATIHPVLFVLAKCALVPPHVLLASAAFRTSRGSLQYPRVSVVAWTAVIVGLAVAVAATRHLGESIRVGLPDERTELRVQGLYRFSRNPIYAGLFVSMLGSCLLVPSTLNLAAAVTAIILHDRIVRAEERFLENRFGQSWLDYRARVRRYI